MINDLGFLSVKAVMVWYVKLKFGDFCLKLVFVTYFFVFLNFEIMDLKIFKTGMYLQVVLIPNP